jgi:hypothetical protein
MKESALKSEARNLKPLRRRSAFTLPELVVATAVSVVVFTLALGSILGTLRLWRESMTQSHLSRQSRIVRERLLRGVQGQYGLRHASRATLSYQSNAFVFADAADGSVFGIVCRTGLPVWAQSGTNVWWLSSLRDVRVAEAKAEITSHHARVHGVARGKAPAHAPDPRDARDGG